ncbi:MAG: phage tail tape measure protein [Anaerolineae bacterium]|nr:phage tail tape measure protein [Anaerolineae bacterium]
MASPMAGAVNLGSAYGEVLIDYSNVERNLQNVMATVERGVANSMNRVGANLQRIGTAVTIATLPIAGFVRQGIAAFANFEEVLAEIEARTGATADQMKIVEQVALDMGKQTAFSAKEAAEGMLQLLASGMDTNQAIAALRPTLDLAAAGHIQLAEAASVVTTILGQFNLEADQSGRVADALARASAASRAEVSDLGQAFANVGPIANRFGLSVEDTAAILAQFANNGIMGAEAGTQLKSMLTNLTRPTDDVQKMWKQLGVNLYDAEGRIRPLNAVLQDLNGKLATMTEQDRNEAIITLAGSYGQMGLEVLLASNGFDTMAASMEKQAGAAKVAERWMTTLKGKLESMLGSLETVMIRIFKPLAENILKPLIDRGIEMLNWVSDVLEKSPALAYGLGLVLSVLILLGPGLIAVGTGLRLISMLMSTFSIGSAMAAIGPFLPMLLAVAAALGVLVLAYKTNLLGFADFVNGFVTEVGRLVDTVQGFIDRIREVGLSEALQEFYAAGGPFQKMGKGVVKGILDIVGAIGGFIRLIRKDGFIAAWEQVFTTLGDGSSWIGNILQSFGMAQVRAEAIGRTINRFALAFMNGVQAVRRFVTGLVAAFEAGGLRGVFDTLRQAAIEGLPIFLEGLNTLISGAWAWIRAQAPGLAQNLGEMVGRGLRTLVDLIIQYGPTVLAGLVALLAIVGQWLITTGIPEFFGLAVDVVDGFMQGFNDGMGDVNWNEVWRDVWNGAKKAAGVALALLWNTSIFVREKIIDPMIKKFKEIEWDDVGRDVWEMFERAMTLAVETYYQVGPWLDEKIIDPMIKKFKEIKWNEVGRDLWQAFKTAMNLAVLLYFRVGPWLDEKVINPLVAKFKAINWTQIATDIWNGLINGLESMWDSLDIDGLFRGFAERGWNSFMEGIGAKSPSRKFWEAGKAIVDGLQNGINDNAQGAVNAAMMMANQINGQVQGAMAQINALNALAMRPMGISSALPALAPAPVSSTISNTNFGGISVIVPHNSIPQTNNPQLQGAGIGRGIQTALQRRGSGTRRV